MLPRRFLCLLFVVSSLVPAFAQGRRNRGNAGGDEAARGARSEARQTARREAGNGAAGTENRSGPEAVMRAHAAAYPGAIAAVEYRNGDWAVLLRGTWFYHAGGRFLPEKHLQEAETYARQSFYPYPAELPPWKEPEGEQAERLRNVLANRRANPPKRDPEFYDTLWQAHNRKEAEANLVSIRFLGKELRVHKELAERLKKISALVMEEAGTDPEIKAFIDNIGSLGAWNWRSVAATASRSYHSYAVALDILPKNLRGQASYWQWTADRNPDWYKVPYSGRWHPPLRVVRIFERYGFCWGGKWALFDTMHFEYRPEILLLSGMKVENP